MAHKYILNYFNVTGRGELARMLFHAAGVEFTDNQITMPEWPQLKSDASRFPLGNMPVLQVDGEPICQSQTINRFLAREFNLYGSSNQDQALTDQVIDTINDLAEGLQKILFDPSKDANAKKAAYAEYLGGARAKQLFGFVTGKLKSKNGSFFLGDKVTYADLGVYVVYDLILVLHPNVANEQPELAALWKSISDVETIKKYLSSRKHGHYGV